jgi:hypothetical protein
MDARRTVIPLRTARVGDGLAFVKSSDWPVSDSAPSGWTTKTILRPGRNPDRSGGDGARPSRSGDWKKVERLIDRYGAHPVPNRLNIVLGLRRSGGALLGRRHPCQRRTRFLERSGVRVLGLADHPHVCGRRGRARIAFWVLGQAVHLPEGSSASERARGRHSVPLPPAIGS